MYKNDKYYIILKGDHSMTAYGDNWIRINAKKKWLHEQYLRTIKEEETGESAKLPTDGQNTGESAELRTDGHYDIHGLKPEHLEFIRTHPEVLAAKGAVTLTLPDHLPSLPSALVRASENQVHYARRPGRNYPSRLIHGEYQPTREVTVISKKGANGKAFVVTAFGGKLAPKEVGDPSHTEESRKESEAFWAKHALLTGETREQRDEREAHEDHTNYTHHGLEIPPRPHQATFNPEREPAEDK